MRGALTFAAMLLAAGPAAATVPPLPSCDEADGTYTTGLTATEDGGFALASRVRGDRYEVVLASCASGTELRAFDNPESGLTAMDVLNNAIQSRKSFTFDAIARQLRFEGHEAKIVKMTPPTCICGTGY